MPAFCGEDVIMGQIREISTANFDREWTRLRRAFGAASYELTRIGEALGLWPCAGMFAGAACLRSDRAAERESGSPPDRAASVTRILFASIRVHSRLCLWSVVRSPGTWIRHSITRLMSLSCFWRRNGG